MKATTHARLDDLHQHGVIEELDRHFARGLSRMTGEQRAEVLAAIALVSRQVGRGHVCLDLNHFAGTALTDSGSF